jgi:hypothetical protein
MRRLACSVMRQGGAVLTHAGVNHA